MPFDRGDNFSFTLVPVLVLVGIDFRRIYMRCLARNAVLANPHVHWVLGIGSPSGCLLHNRARLRKIDSGSSARKGVGVQVPPSAPITVKGLFFLFTEVSDLVQRLFKILDKVNWILSVKLLLRG